MEAAVHERGRERKLPVVALFWAVYGLLAASCVFCGLFNYGFYHPWLEYVASAGIFALAACAVFLAMRQQVRVYRHYRLLLLSLLLMFAILGLFGRLWYGLLLGVMVYVLRKAGERFRTSARLAIVSIALAIFALLSTAYWLLLEAPVTVVEQAVPSPAENRAVVEVHRHMPAFTHGATYVMRQRILPGMYVERGVPLQVTGGTIAVWQDNDHVVVGGRVLRARLPMRFTNFFTD